MMRLPGTTRHPTAPTAPEGDPMPVNPAPAAMVETPMRPVLTAVGTGCKSCGGASMALTETCRVPRGWRLRRGATGDAFFALVGVATAVRRTSGQRVGFVMPATAGDVDAG